MPISLEESRVASNEESAVDIAFVFDDVEGWQALAAAFKPGVEVHVLDAGRDGLHQIAEILQGRSGIDALHIVGHGAPGTLELGALTLNAGNIAQYTALLGDIGASLTPDGDILLYGCDVAADARGASFVGQIANATGADIAASVDVTGGAQLGGDWTLEYRTGSIAQDGAFDAAAVRSLDTLLLAVEDVSSTMRTGTGNFIPGFILTSAATVQGDPTTGGNGSIYFITTGKTVSFTVSADGSSVGRFDLSDMSFLKTIDPSSEYTITVTGYKAGGGTATAVLTSPSGYDFFIVTDSFADMTALTSFDVVMTQTGTQNDGATPTDLSFDAFTVDNIAPPAPSTPDLTSATDLGTSNSDNRTSANTLAFTGTGPAGDSSSTVQVFIDRNGNGAYDAGTDLSGSSTLSNGAWTVSGLSTLALADGSYNVYAQLTSNGASSALSSALSLTVDHTAPTVTVSSNTPSLKAGETAAITFTFSEDPGSSFTWNGSSGDVGVSGGTLSAISGSGFTRSATFTPNSNTDAGTASISVNASSYADVAGNNGSAGSTSIAFDTKAPTLTITSDVSSLRAGQSAEITFTFSEDPGASFSWDGSSGDISVSGGTLSAISGTGTTRTATFTPTAGVNAGTAGITVGSGAYTDAAGNGGGVGSSPTLHFDTLAPTVAITSDKAALLNAETATITFTFSEDPDTSFSWDGTSGDLVVTGGTLGAISGTGTTRTATFTPDGSSSTGSIALADGGYTDAAGNTGAGDSSPDITLTQDTTPPDAPSTPVPAAGSDSGTSSSDGVTKLTTPTLEGTAEPGATVKLYDGATLVGTGSADRSGNWSITTSTLAEGAHAITALAVDAANNASDASVALELTVDTTAPTLTITSDQTALKSGETATITFTFTQDPGNTFTWDGASGDIVATGGTLGAISGTGLTRTAVFTPEADTNAGTASISVAAGAYTDAAGNDGADAALDGIVFDTLVPTLTITSDKTALKVGETATITFTYSEDPGLEPGTVTVTGGTLGEITGTGTVRTAVFTPDADTNAGTADIGVSAGSFSDDAGNAGTVSATPTISFDTLAPDAPSTLALDAGSESGAASDDNITTDTTPTVNGTAEAGASVDLYDGATLVGSGTADGDGHWSITASVRDEGDHTFTAVATDAAGNAGAASSPLQVRIDTTAPTLAISSDKSALKMGETATITFTFSEDPGSSFGWDGASGDIGLSGGTLSAISGTGSTRTAIFTPTADTNAGTASITVAGGAYTDTAGNAGGAGATPSLQFDTLAPTLTITSDVASLKIGDTATITFTFTEDPGTSFAWDGSSGDVAVTGGTLSAIAGTGLVRTAVFTPDASTNGGTASITVGAAAYVDAAGNEGAAGATPSITFDTLAPATPSTPALADGSDTGASTTDGLTNAVSPVLEGTAEAGATVTLFDTDGTEIGSGVATGGVWRITTDALDDGEHSITAVATDAAGNDSTASAGLLITIDATPPGAPAALDLADASDNGDSSSDDITYDDTPTLTGTAEADSTVTLYDTDGTTVLGTAVATGGTWSITSSALASGVHALTAVAVDAAGNASDASAALSITISEPLVLNGGTSRDVLVGSDGDDTLDAGKGADTMIGGDGDDTYVVDHQRDVVMEADGEGADHVYSSARITLAPNVEDVTLTGIKSLDAIGNELDNALEGNVVRNTLQGGLGSDTLTGGLGADRFAFVSADESGLGGWDLVTDFNSAEGDRIDLRKVDADMLSRGRQHFEFIGGAAFSGTDATGQLRFDSGTHMLYGSTDADADAEFAVELAGVTVLTLKDLAL